MRLLETDMEVFSSPAFDAHEQVVFFYDAGSGLEAIVALHDTTLGPALGGCRMWPYQSEAEALTDVIGAIGANHAVDLHLVLLPLRLGGSRLRQNPKDERQAKQ